MIEPFVFKNVYVSNASSPLVIRVYSIITFFASEIEQIMEEIARVSHISAIPACELVFHLRSLRGEGAMYVMFLISFATPYHID